MRKPENHEDSLLFLLTLQPNPRFVKQINYFSKYFKVSVLYFRRETMIEYSSEINSEIQLVDLGVIQNGRYLRRTLSFIRNSIVLKAHIKKHHIDHIIFDKFDAYLLFFILQILTFSKFKNIQKIIEIPDLKSIHFSNNPKARIYRSFEKHITKKYIDKLILTSPGYYDIYFKSFYKGGIYILENKPLKENLPKIEFKEKSNNNNNQILKIGIIGGLNRGKPTHALLELAIQKPWIHVFIHGLGPNETMIKKYSENYKNITYFGPFNFFRDSSKIYRSIDVAYVVYDTTNVSLNTKYALPNKLYECMYFGVPMIVSKDTLLAERVVKDNIGLAVDFSQKDILLNTLTHFRDNKNMFKNSFKKIQTDSFLGNNDYKEIIRFIKSK